MTPLNLLPGQTPRHRRPGNSDLGNSDLGAPDSDESWGEVHTVRAEGFGSIRCLFSGLRLPTASNWSYQGGATQEGICHMGMSHSSRRKA